MSDTVHLGLPLLEASQSQKHVTHNEALALIDASVHLAVLSRGLTAPPVSPAEGDRYLVPAGATGAWSSHAGELAVFLGGDWLYAPPRPGWRCWSTAEAKLFVFDGAVWQDVAAATELQNMTLLGVNATADAGNRLTVSSAAVLLTHAGSDQRLKLNKNASGDTASLLMQDNFSGRAELGLSGDDDFHFKVSADGSAWTEALTIDRTTGAVNLPAGLVAGMATPLTAFLNPFTSGLKGLVPASGGGTANFLRADGTWSAPSGGGGGSGDVLGPGSANDTAIARFDSATGKLIQNSGILVTDGDELDLPYQPAASAPAASRLKLFAGRRGGRMVPRCVGPEGPDYTLQPHIAFNAIAQWQPAGNSTTVTATGAAALSATGTATAGNAAVTNLYTLMKRVEYLVTAASTTAVAGFRSTTALYLAGGPAADQGGFFFVCRWGPATGAATATARAFAGLGNATTAPTDVEPSSIINIIGMGWDAADANIQLMHRGAGAVTKIDLGAGFPVPAADRTKVYELAMYSPPGLTQAVHYEVRELGTANLASGTITSNLPSTATFLAPRGWMSVGGTTSEIGIALMGLYIETDL